MPTALPSRPLRRAKFTPFWKNIVLSRDLGEWQPNIPLLQSISSSSGDIGLAFLPREHTLSLLKRFISESRTILNSANSLSLKKSISGLPFCLKKKTQKTTNDVMQCVGRIWLSSDFTYLQSKFTQQTAAILSTLSDFSPTSPSTSSTTLLGDCCVNSIVEQKTEIWNDALDEEDLDDVRSSNAAAPDHCDINPGHRGDVLHAASLFCPISPNLYAPSSIFLGFQWNCSLLCLFYLFVCCRWSKTAGRGFRL